MSLTTIADTAVTRVSTVDIGAAVNAAMIKPKPLVGRIRQSKKPLSVEVQA